MTAPASSTGPTDVPANATQPPLHVGGGVYGTGREAPPHLVHPQDDPMPNARIMVKHWFTMDGQQLLVYHRGSFRRWDGTAWPELEEDAVEAAVWSFFEHAGWIKETRWYEPEWVPFQPNRSKVADIFEALTAVVFVDAVVEMPSWRAPGLAEMFPPTETVAMANGILHVPSRVLIPATPAYFNTYALPYDFDPHARPPTRWLSFLDELWPDDDESKDTLQEIFGYVLLADTSQQKIIFLVGPKRSGKGTIARVVRGLLGTRSVAGPTLASLGTNFGLQALLGKPLAIISDARLGTRTDSSVVTERLLTISGEDAITADRKYKEPWTGTLPTRLMIISNELPRLSDSSGALASRFLVLKTTESFFGREDSGLTDALLAELPGILLWALDGYERLQARGHFVQPTSSTEVIADLEDLASPVGTFLRERCDQGVEYEVPVTDLYTAWRVWCERNGRAATNAQTFGRDLRAVLPHLRVVQHRTGDGDGRERVYQGIRLRPAPVARSW